MKSSRIKFVFLFLLLIFIFDVFVYADSAEDITSGANIRGIGINIEKITDNIISTRSSGENVSVSIISDIPMGGIYIIYDGIPSGGKLNGVTDIAKNGFMHEYVELGGETQAVISFDKTSICDIRVFSTGVLPDDVQRWQKGEDDTDLLLCATHSDDDQLFFAGLLPYYAGHIGANVRVAYFINHFDTYNRTHELLDALWHCGVRNYPDISPFPDVYSESASDAELYLKNRGFTYEDVLSFQRKLLEKYNPLVVVLHDFDGEYGHGAHMLNAKSFIEVCENSSENQYIPEKIYVHLYNVAPITLELDEPLDIFGGKSAFQVSQEAFGFHKSQHWTWFYEWIYGKNSDITKASQIRNYNPCRYGLYYSSVGEDIYKNDILENIETYGVRRQKEIELAELQRIELEEKRDIMRKDIPDTQILSEDIDEKNTDEHEEYSDNTKNELFVFFVIAFFSILFIINCKKRR